LKDYGEIPGGNCSLKELLYPFQSNYPLKLWSKYRWRKNKKLRIVLPTLNQKEKWLTVVDRLGAPGDALITSNVIRYIKKTYPRIKINCITPNPELIKFDPDIDSLNQNETFYSFDSSYWELIQRKEKKENIVEHNLKKLGISNFKYKANFHLSKDEVRWGKQKVEALGHNKLVLAICTKSKEKVKNWPKPMWDELLNLLHIRFSIIQLGDKHEPFFSSVTRFAGKLSMRESASILSHANYFIGPDSLLMHIANGLNIPSTIIFGGSRPVDCFGYSENVNLKSTPECSPCWIHEGHDVCSNAIACMSAISVDKVFSFISKKF
tara:strand:- start:2876 stop:3841 length:966 start_codon:yes stop_codon:yes gene_type:complete